MSAQTVDNQNSNAATQESLSYEAAFAQLESILARLESSDLPLEEALHLYEQGNGLTAYCAKLLDEAELRVRQWQADGSTRPLLGWQEK